MGLTDMIAAISMMQRKPGLSLAQFRKHWLDPHGVLTAGLPGLRFYIQSHCVEGRGTNALARELAIDGFPELWFESYEARKIAYTSPRIAECNVDSESFVGAVCRLVTEPQVVIAPPEARPPAKVIMLATGAPDPGWSERIGGRVARTAGVTGFIRHRLLEQAAAPASRIPELKVPVAGFAEVTFADETALATALPALVGEGPDAARTATWRVEDYRLL